MLVALVAVQVTLQCDDDDDDGDDDDDNNEVTFSLQKLLGGIFINSRTLANGYFHLHISIECFPKKKHL